MRKTLCLLLAALFLVTAGCGDDSPPHSAPAASTPVGLILEESAPAAASGPGVTSVPITLPPTTPEPSTLPPTTPEPTTPPPTTAPEPQMLAPKPPSSKWYAKVLDSLVQMEYYAFYDVNRDGSVELIVMVGTCEADYRYLFYSQEGGVPCYLGWVGGAVSHLASDGRELIVAGGRQGHEWAYYLDILQDQIWVKEEHSRDVGMDGEYTQYPYYLKTYDPPAWNRDNSPVRAVYARDFSLYDYDVHRAEQSAYLEEVALFTWETVTDLCLLRMAYLADGQPTQGEIVHYYGRLTPDRQVVYGVTFSDVRANYGVRFTDRWGKTWFFALETSGLDGSLIFTPFTPAKPAAGEGAERLDGLWVQYAEDVQLGDHHSFAATASEYSVEVVLGTDRNLRDFMLLELTVNSEFQIAVADAVYTRDSLTPGKPVVLRVTMGEIMPHYGICYTDGSGVTHYYAIDDSGEDGSAYLYRFTPAPLNPETTPEETAPEATPPEASPEETAPEATPPEASPEIGACTRCGAQDALREGLCQACYDYENEVPNVHCEGCGYAFFETGVGIEGLFCPNCGYAIVPPQAP